MKLELPPKLNASVGLEQEKPEDNSPWQRQGACAQVLEDEKKTLQLSHTRLWNT